MSPRTFTVSRGRAFVGTILGDELSNYSREELEAMVKHMDEFYAEEEEAARREAGSGAQDGEE